MVVKEFDPLLELIVSKFPFVVQSVLAVLYDGFDSGGPTECHGVQLVVVLV